MNGFSIASRNLVFLFEQREKRIPVDIDERWDFLAANGEVVRFRLIIVSREEWGILGKEISPLIIIEWIYFVSQLENIYIYIYGLLQFLRHLFFTKKIYPSLCIAGKKRNERNDLLLKFERKPKEFENPGTDKTLWRKYRSEPSQGFSTHLPGRGRAYFGEAARFKPNSLAASERVAAQKGC